MTDCTHGEERAETVTDHHSDWVCVRCQHRRSACGHSDAERAMDTPANPEPLPAEGLREALTAIRDMEPEPVLPYSHPRPCPECKRWEGHPVQRGICDEAYRGLRRRDDAQDHARNAQQYRMRDIARDALRAALKEPTDD